MKQVRRCFLWYRLLTKRLLKKPAFLVILLAVPLLAGAMALVSRQDAGILTVALARRDGDPVAAEAIGRLLSRDGVVRYVEYGSEAEALAAVEGGRADAAWIFRAGAGGELERLAAGSGSRGAAIVVEREDDVFLRLAREQLAAALYPAASRALFREYLVNELGGGAEVPDAVLEEYYNVRETGAKIILFAYDDGTFQDNETNYLIAPVRGLLSMLVVLAGLASCMFYYREEENESFVWLSAGKRRVLPLLCHFCAAVPVMAASLPALWFTGLLTDLRTELGLALLFCLATAGFCELLRRLCRGQALLGALLPVVLAAMLALCPVFLHFKRFRALQYLFPPYYYLNGVYRPGYVWRFLLYIAVTLLLAAALPPKTKK